ncbi:MAG: inositol monophosphatase [Patescibacteria group bacterium]
MYPKIINKIIELGDSLPPLSGHALDIGKSKQYLTEKDIEIETELTNMINAFSGKHSVYAEELHDTFIEEENVWIIDPISNTRNFIHGMPHYSVVLSHLYKGEVLFAVVYDPSNKELFTAEKGKGAYLNNKSVHVSDRTQDTIYMIGPYMTEAHREKSLKIIEGMSKNKSTMRNLGSLGVHYAYVACGRADVAISFNKDTFPEFAGKLLVEEAGGKFTDFKGGVLNNKTEGIIASNNLMYDQVKKLIASVV